MKVLHFYKTALPLSKGGVEVFIDSLCCSTSDLGVENIVLALAEEPDSAPISFDKYTLYQVKQDLFVASTGFSWAAISKFKELAKTVDIVHYHYPNPFADILHFICNIKKPTVITYHSDIVKQKSLLLFYKPLANLFLNSVSNVVSTSPNYFSTSDMLQKYADKVSVIPIGIDKESYPCLNKTRLEYWRERLPQPFFLFVGAMRYYKGLHIAIDAIKDTDMQLVLCGVSGIERELKAHALESGLDSVHFLGMVTDEDKVALLHLCHSFVFPSHLRSEAFGISLLEAAAFGRPLISCEIGTGTSYVNVDRETGLVVKPSCPESLRFAMQYLLDNKEEAAEFGLNAQRRYSTHFTSDKQAKAYYKLYQEMLS